MEEGHVGSCPFLMLFRERTGPFLSAEGAEQGYSKPLKKCKACVGLTCLCMNRLCRQIQQALAKSVAPGERNWDTGRQKGTAHHITLRSYVFKAICLIHFVYHMHSMFQ